jgi:tetratricopeptide (TPR) repeat protein
MPANPFTLLRRSTVAAAVLLSLAIGSSLANPRSLAQSTPVPASASPAPSAGLDTPPTPSAMDASLFYQLLIGEIELRGGNAANAYEAILDAARRTRDETLFRRAADIALQGRAGEQALAAVRAWRIAQPQSAEALRLHLQILMALNRAGEAAEPLRALLAVTPAAERPALIAATPRLFQRSVEPRQLAQVVDDALRPYASAEATRVPVRVAQGRAWAAAGENARALELAREALGLEPRNPAPAMLALELMGQAPGAEELLRQHLVQPQATQAVRLAYTRQLTAAQRYVDAIAQLDIATTAEPSNAPPLLTLGALHLELKHPKEAEAALTRYLALVDAQIATLPPAPPAEAEPDRDDDEAEDDGPGSANPQAERRRAEQGRIQAWLMMAQSAEMRGDFAAAEPWLARIDDPQRALDVQSRRATILARQGRLAEGRALIRALPERKPEEARAKIVAEAGLLREAKAWGEAFSLLAGATQRFADDSDLIYEQAMMAEKLERMDDMERLLRRVMELKPESPHAANALGYSLADRRQRLPEARALIAKALALAPGDPFITDSLGWVEFRMGNLPEALKHLRTAYSARPDPEIGAHLGEVLWAMGQQDEARKVWLEVQRREPTNEVLRETLARLQVKL